MLTDAFADFTLLVKDPESDLPSLLSELESDLDDYSDKSWGYNRKVFPLLRKAARWYVAGKLSWRALNAISLRLVLCYFAEEGTEESLIDDLRAYIRVKPTIDLRTKVGVACRRSRAASRRKQRAAEEARPTPLRLASQNAGPHRSNISNTPKLYAVQSIPDRT